MTSGAKTGAWFFPVQTQCVNAVNALWETDYFQHGARKDYEHGSKNSNKLLSKTGLIKPGQP